MALWLLLGALSYLSFAISTSIDKLMMNKKYDALYTNTLKTFFDALILIVIGLIFFKLEFTPNMIILAIILGAIYAVVGRIYYLVLKLKDVSQTMPYLQSSQILLTFFGSLLLFNEPSNYLNYTGIVLIPIGVYAVLSEKGFKAPKIDKVFFYVLLIVALHIIYWLLAKKMLFDAQPISVGIAMYISCGFFLLIFLLFSRKKNRASQANVKTSQALAAPKHTVPTIAIAAFFGAMGTFLLFSALKVGFASKVYSLAALQPIFIAIIALLFLSEKWHWNRVIGTVIVCAGIFLISV